MQKLLPISLLLCFSVAGCSAFRRSQTWQQVVDSRSQRTAAVSEKVSYTDRLHEVLAARNVEHKIVSYQYRYMTRLREEAVGTGKVVMYRDEATPESPWWMMDEYTGFPIWVPNEEIDRQLSFFLRQDAQVLAQKEYPAGGTKGFGTAPVRANPGSPREMLATVGKPVPSRGTTAPLAAIASGPTDNLAERAAWLDAMQHRFDSKFRARHGTDFDRHSSLDRQKMAEMLRAEAPKGAAL